MGRKIKILFLLVLLVGGLICASGCRTSNVSEAEKRIAKEKKRKAKEDAVLYERARERHMQNQSKQTRKEMKKNLKKAERYNEQKGEPKWNRFWRGLSRPRKTKG